MEEELIREVEKAAPSFMKIGKKMQIDYDEKADVLYISFEKPQKADDSVMEDDVIIHKRADKVVGLSILHASKFKAES